MAATSLQEYAPPDPAQLDVHSNQYGLLAASKCFQASDALTCTTCHAPHHAQHDLLVHAR